jgi:N-acetylmuramoyl-L-alanine amidase
MSTKVIVIDPGHGGTGSPGAVGPSNTQEKDVVLSYAYQLQNLLLMGYRTHMTRQDDRYVSLNDRARYANNLNADIFVSLHCNGFRDPSAHGLEIYTYRGVTKADKLATYLYEAIKEEFNDITLRADWSDDDPDKEAGFTVLRKTKMPAVLIELGFITNPEEEKRLLKFSHKVRMCQAICNGIDNYTLWS